MDFNIERDPDLTFPTLKYEFFAPKSILEADRAQIERIENIRKKHSKFNKKGKNRKQQAKIDMDSIEEESGMIAIDEFEFELSDLDESKIMANDNEQSIEHSVSSFINDMSSKSRLTPSVFWLALIPFINYKFAPKIFFSNFFICFAVILFQTPPNHPPIGNPNHKK